MQWGSGGQGCRSCGHGDRAAAADRAASGGEDAAVVTARNGGAAAASLLGTWRRKVFQGLVLLEAAKQDRESLQREHTAEVRGDAVDI